MLASRDVLGSSELNVQLKPRPYFMWRIKGCRHLLGKLEIDFRQNTFYAACMVCCSSRSAQFALKGLLVASVSKLFISPSCLLLVLWLLPGSVTGTHRAARCVSVPASYIFPFPIRWLHTWRFLWTLLTSAFTHGLHLPLLLFYLSHPHFSPPRALKTSWSCQVAFSTSGQLLRTVNPYPPSPILCAQLLSRLHLRSPLSLVSCPISPTPTPSLLHVMPLRLWIQLFTSPIFPLLFSWICLWLCEGWWVADFGLISLWWKH